MINPKNQDLKQYDDKLLNTEMQLLIDWYLDKNLNKNQQAQLHHIFKLLTDNALNSPQVFVHRDYHARNLMLSPAAIA